MVRKHTLYDFNPLKCMETCSRPRHGLSWGMFYVYLRRNKFSCCWWLLSCSPLLIHFRGKSCHTWGLWGALRTVPCVRTWACSPQHEWMSHRCCTGPTGAFRQMTVALGFLRPPKRFQVRITQSNHSLHLNPEKLRQLPTTLLAFRTSLGARLSFR